MATEAAEHAAEEAAPSAEELCGQITEVFKRFDKRGKGKITGAALAEVLKQLDGACWTKANVDELVKATGLQDPVTGDVDYEELVEWIMQAPEGPLEGHPVCQAAFEGDVCQLEELLEGVTQSSIDAAVGYVKVGEDLCGLWSMVANTFQLKALQHDATLKAPTPLQWAAFAGHAEAVRFLVERCGFRKDDEGLLGHTAFAVAVSHRLDADGGVVQNIGDEEVKHLLEDEQPVLCPNALSKVATGRPAALAD